MYPRETSCVVCAITKKNKKTKKPLLDSKSRKDNAVYKVKTFQDYLV